MKILSSLAFFLFLSSMSWSQENIDKRLLKKYSVEEIKALESSQPDELKILVYALDNAVYFANYSSAKGQQFEEIERPKKNQTFIDLNLDILNQNQYFKIKGEEKLLVVKSKQVLMHEMKSKK